MCAISAGSSAPPSADREAAEHPLVDEAQLVGSVAGGAAPAGGISSGAPAGTTSSWPLMPRCASRASPLSSGEPEVLAAPPGRLDAAAGQAGREVGRAADVAAHRRGWQHVDRRRCVADDVGLESAADDLDLGKLRHSGSAVVLGARLGRRRRPRAAQRVGRLGRLLLGLLLRAADAVAVDACSPTRTRAVNVFLWSGPSSSMRYSGTPRAWSAASSCRLVFQSRPAPIAAAAAISGSKSRCTTSPAIVEAPGEVDRPDHRLDGVGQDRRLVAPPGGLLAPAEPDVLTQADRASDLGQRAGVDDGGAQLGQPALGEVGMGAVERLGDDHAEHGVAEELQPLVGGQPAVLVGVRAVGQGALEQLGVQTWITERCAARDGASLLRTSRTTRPSQRSEDLATVAAGAVLAALAGRRGAAGAWRRTRGWRRSPARERRLPRRTAVARVAARHLPLRDSHESLLIVGLLGSAGLVSVLWSGSASAAQRAHRGSTGSSCRCRVVRRAARRTRRTARDSPPGTAAGTAVRAPPRPAAVGSRSNRSPSRRADLVVLLVGGRSRVVIDEQLLEGDLDSVLDRLQATCALALAARPAPSP